MKRFLNYLLIAATVCGISFAAASCSKDDDENNVEALTAERLAGLWVTEYAESGTDGERTWTRALEDYRFNADGTGYYESYLLDGQNYASAVLVRDEGALHFTITGSTVSITDDKTSSHWTLTYADGKLTAQGRTWQKATADQQTLVNQLYGDWQASNSDTGKTDDSKLENVDGNVDINNGGGGVNTVR
jgi:hypothetical protein